MPKLVIQDTTHYFKDFKELAEKHKSIGGMYFEHDYKKCFGAQTFIVTELIEGKYFISKDLFFSDSKPKFTVRLATKYGYIHILDGTYRKFSTVDEALEHLKNYVNDWRNVLNAVPLKNLNDYYIEEEKQTYLETISKYLIMGQLSQFKKLLKDLSNESLFELIMVKELTPTQYSYVMDEFKSRGL